MLPPPYSNLSILRKKRPMSGKAIRPTRSSPKQWLDSTYHPTYAVVTQDVVVKVLDAMHPEPSGAITVGHMDTRPCTPAPPA